MNCSVMASKVGALAVGAKADNTSEANGLIPPDKFCDNPSCLAHSFLGKKEPPLRSLCRVLCGCGRRLAGVVHRHRAQKKKGEKKLANLDRSTSCWRVEKLRV